MQNIGLNEWIKQKEKHNVFLGHIQYHTSEDEVCVYMPCMWEDMKVYLNWTLCPGQLLAGSHSLTSGHVQYSEPNTVLLASSMLLCPFRVHRLDQTDPIIIN